MRPESSAQKQHCPKETGFEPVWKRTRDKVVRNRIQLLNKHSVKAASRFDKFLTHPTIHNWQGRAVGSSYFPLLWQEAVACGQPQQFSARGL